MAKKRKRYSKENLSEFVLFSRLTFAATCAFWIVVFVICPLVYGERPESYVIFSFAMACFGGMNVTSSFNYADYGDFHSKNARECIYK